MEPSPGLILFVIQNAKILPGFPSVPTISKGGGMAPPKKIADLLQSVLFKFYFHNCLPVGEKGGRETPSTCRDPMGKYVPGASLALSNRRR